MGENEQGGMLRTVVVVGIIAMIALIITLAVVGLKNNMTKNTNSAVGAVVKTKIPYGVVNPDVTYKKYTPDNSDNVWSDHGNHSNYFPVVGDMPNNSWREDRLVVNASARIYIRVDINDSPETTAGYNDNDDRSKRLIEVYDENGNKSVTNDGEKGFLDRAYLDKDKDYTIVVKYFNNSGRTFIEREGEDHSWSVSRLLSGTDDGSSYKLKIKSFEAATYDDKYTK